MGIGLLSYTIYGALIGYSILTSFKEKRFTSELIIMLLLLVMYYSAIDFRYGAIILLVFYLVSKYLIGVNKYEQRIKKVEKNKEMSEMKTKLLLQFKKNPLQILQWSSANAIIDGRNHVKVPWTDKIGYSINEGHHKVQMSFPYLGSEVGKADIEFDIKEGETLLVTYKPPLLAFGSGTILVQNIK